MNGDQPRAQDPSREGQERTPGTDGQQDRAVVPRSVEGQRAPGKGPQGQTDTFVHPSRRGGNNR
jgi:hypothetical protein